MSENKKNNEFTNFIDLAQSRINSQQTPNETKSTNPILQLLHQKAKKISESPRVNFSPRLISADKTLTELIIMVEEGIDIPGINKNMLIEHLNDPKDEKYVQGKKDYEKLKKETCDYFGVTPENLTLYQKTLLKLMFPKD